MRIARAVLRGGFDDGAHVGVVADGAGIDAHGRGAGLERGARQAPVEVDVGDDRHGRVAHDLGEGVDVGGGRQRDAHQLAAGRRQRADLLKGRRGVGGGRVGHGLHDHRGAAAYRYGADVDLSHAAHGAEDTTGRRRPLCGARRRCRRRRRRAVAVSVGRSTAGHGAPNTRARPARLRRATTRGGAAAGSALRSDQDGAAAGGPRHGDVTAHAVAHHARSRPAASPRSRSTHSSMNVPGLPAQKS